VSVIRTDPTPRGAGHLVRAVVAAWLLVLAIAAPTGAVEGPTKLFDPTVTPRTATPTTTITFSVEYRNREGSAPAYVRVVIDGKAHDMAGDGGSNWKKGVGHTYSTKLAAGTHTVAFVASDTRKFTGEIGGGTVTVKVASPAPTPTPTPKPKPTPAPVSGGGSGAAGGAGTGGSGGNTGTDGTGGGSPAGSGGSGAPGSTGGSGPDAQGTSGSGGGGDLGSGARGLDTQTWGGAATGADGEWTPVWHAVDRPNPTSTSGSGGPATTAGDMGADDGRRSARGSAADGASGSGLTWGALAAALESLGVHQGPGPLAMLPTLVGTTGAVAMAMAFAIFGKKRRDEEPPAPDEVLQANAARGTDVAASGELAHATAAAPVDVEASMPRWRRPSLQEARKADPTRSVNVAPRLRFDEDAVSGVGYERRIIRYRVVSLLDAPDELRSAEIGQLDQGDEVQLLEKSGAYWLVNCPDGRQGWLHQMTLGDAVTDNSAAEAADAWNVGDIDGDVLSAYLAARARA
jgi:hypothetical protein